MKEKFILFFRYNNRFGIIKGLLLFFKNYVFHFCDSRITLPKLSFPFYLRKKTSDLQTFNQVFLNMEYGYKLSFTPKFIIDCGANIGLATLFFKSKYPSSTIVSIEPETSNYKSLLKNTKKYNNIYTIQAGIWNKNTFLNVEDVWNFGNWGFVCTEVNKNEKNCIQALTINDIMLRFKKTEIDLLKIDIEGAELEVFSSNYEEWLPKTKVLMIELHDAYRVGCSNSFFKAIVNYNFSIYHSGENIVCIRN